MDTLPEEVYLDSLFPFLCVSDLGKLACVSRGSRVLADNNDAWRLIYTGCRKRTFSIVPASEHKFVKSWNSCGSTMAHSVWVDGGSPCTKQSHYRPSTLKQDTKENVNYHNFKRAVAKVSLARIPRFDLPAARHLDGYFQYQQWCWREVVRIESEITVLKKRRDAPANFAQILALPPSTPPHMKRTRQAKPARKALK